MKESCLCSSLGRLIKKKKLAKKERDYPERKLSRREGRKALSSFYLTEARDSDKREATPGKVCSFSLLQEALRHPGQTSPIVLKENLYEGGEKRQPTPT